MVTLKGTIEEIIFHNEENGYVVALIYGDDGDYHYVKGYLPIINEGDSMIFHGEWQTHNTYGEQLAVDHSEVVLPTEVEAIEKYLASGMIRGIGPSTAKKIIEAFGGDALDIIQYNPDKLIEIQGIGENKAAIIAESFFEQRVLKDIMIFLQQHGIPLAYGTRIFRKYGQHTIEKITKNPYCLAEDISGIGFKKADAIALTLGVDAASEFRMTSGIQYILMQYMKNGHTYIVYEDLIRMAREQLIVAPEIVATGVQHLITEGKIMMQKVDEDLAIYLTNAHEAESYVCNKLIELSGAKQEKLHIDLENNINDYEERFSIELADEQRQAIHSAFSQGVMVITGGPGTGKTTIINAIIKIYEAIDKEIHLAAPTGRAAKRMSEATNRDAKTIHRLLEFQYYEDDDYSGFNRDEENPLHADVVIIDEVSMVDIFLMQSLLKAVNYNTKLILVGDSDQLPSVGAGNVLKDIIDGSVIEVVQLKQIFRQAQESMIVVNAHKINHGEFPLLNEKDKDFFFINAKSQEDIVELIKGLTSERLKNWNDYDPLQDIQVITPQKNNPVGTNNLNEVLQGVLNQKSKYKKERKFGNRIFRVCDKVMQIRNNYNIEWQGDGGIKGKGIFNGDIGFIEDIDEVMREVTIVFDEDKKCIFEFKQMEEIIHAYAITVHKSQGSEIPVVVMPITWGSKLLLNRKLLYTAVTRAKELVVLVGMQQYLDQMIKNVDVYKRKSGLAFRFNKFFDEHNKDQ